MTSEISVGELEARFRKISVKRPTEDHLIGFTQTENQPEVVAFLVTKLEEYARRLRNDGPWDDDLEWGAIWATRLLGEFSAEPAIAPMIDILGIMIDEYMAIIFGDLISALQKMGPPAFEPVYRKYQQDIDHPEHHDIWIDIMVNLGVHDARLKEAILRLYRYAPIPAAHAMADYGDPEFLSLLEKIVYDAADTLNWQQIDPFASYMRFYSKIAEIYIETRGDLIKLRDGFDYGDPRHDAAEAALDRQLLKYADMDAHEARRKRVMFPTLDDPIWDPEPIIEPSSRMLKKSEFVIARSEATKQSPMFIRSPRALRALAMTGNRVLQQPARTKVGRNAPCPCGSGKKYKKCCGKE